MKGPTIFIPLAGATWRRLLQLNPGEAIVHKLLNETRMRHWRRLLIFAPRPSTPPRLALCTICL